MKLLSPYMTLENVLKPSVGAVEDEFDDEAPAIVEEGNGRFIVGRDAPLAAVNRRLNLLLEADDADTLSGNLTAKVGQVLQGATSSICKARWPKLSKSMAIARRKHVLL